MSSLKVNKYSSFNGLKVLPTKNLIKVNPSICVILAYLHAKKIIKNNIKYLNQVENFILFPVIKIISISNYKKFIC